MMSARVVISVILLTVAGQLVGCSRTVPLTLAANTPVSITIGAHHYIVAASDPRCGRLREWLAQNQHRWSPAFATNPSGGVIVTSGDLWLQFVGTAVFTRTKDGLLRKDVQPADYAFLQQGESSNQAMQRTTR